MISFEMHHLPAIRQSLRRDNLSFLSLALLFRGYVIRDQGILLKGRIASWESRSTRGDVQQVIARIKSKEISENSLRVLPGINAKAQREISLEIARIPKEIKKDCQSDVFPMPALLRNGYYRLGYWKKQREDFEIWTLKKDAYYFVLGYLEQAPSPYGFLFDIQQDLVVRRMLKTNTVGMLLDMATLWWPRLPKEALTDGVRTKFQEGLEQMSHNDLLAVQWSRRVMQAIVSLDEALSAIVQHERMKDDNTGIVWRSIGAIYACNEDFQKVLGQCLSGIHLDGGDKPQENISFDIGGGTIKVPGEEAEFSFDFDHLFPETMMTPKPPGRITSMTSVNAMFACLQGQLRAIAWKMSLSPAHLKKLDSEIRETCYISTSKFHRLSSRSPGRRRRSSSSRSNSWRTHDVESLAQRRQSSERRQSSVYGDDFPRPPASRSGRMSSSQSLSTSQDGNARLGQEEGGQEPMDV